MAALREFKVVFGRKAIKDAEAALPTDRTWILREVSS